MVKETAGLKLQTTKKVETRNYFSYKIEKKDFIKKEHKNFVQL